MMEELAPGGIDGLSSHEDAKSTFEDPIIDQSSLLSSARGFWVQQEYGSQLAVTALTSTLVVLVTVWCIHRALQQRRRKLPPGPWRWPILGNLPNLATGDLPHRTLWSLSNKFGGLMFLQLGACPCIVVSTAAVAKELFQKNDAIFASRPVMSFWTTKFKGSTDYRSLVGCAYGSFWRQLRRLCVNELFSPMRHALHQKVRIEEVHDMMKLVLKNSSKGHTIHLLTHLHAVAANNSTRMITNKRYYGDGVKDQREKEELEQLINVTVAWFSKIIISDFVPSLSFITKLQGIYSQLEEFHKYDKEVVERIFEPQKHRERAQERLQQHREEEEYVADFVDVLQAAPLEDGKTLPDTDISTILSELLLAGTETISTTVEWAMAELIRHPDILKRAQRELDTVIGVDRLVEESDIPKLPYLQAVVKEAFRMHPALPVSIPHQATQASNVMGFSLPADTRLILNIFAIHRDASVYDKPHAFNPQRFVEHPEVNQTSAYDSYELMPFGAGRRMCPGLNIGNGLVSLLLAHLLHSFDWSLPQGHTLEALDMSESSSSLTVNMKTPLRLVAHPRSPAFLY